MARDLSTPMISGPGSITSNHVYPAFLVDITFHTQTEHVWTGVGNLVWNGNTYKGVGSLGKVGAISESAELSAQGTSISLSGIDPVLLAESLGDIQLMAPADIWFVLFDQYGNILGTPYLAFGGVVDQPVLDIGTEELRIELKLESRLADLQRASSRRYTSADQMLYYPTDMGLHWVEILNDQALLWAP
jgi:hypothetical protein